MLLSGTTFPAQGNVSNTSRGPAPSPQSTQSDTSPGGLVSTRSTQRMSHGCLPAQAIDAQTGVPCASPGLTSTLALVMST